MQDSKEVFPLEGAVTDKQICAYLGICYNSLQAGRKKGTYPKGTLNGRSRRTEAAEVRAVWKAIQEKGEFHKPKVGVES